jgi:hypothetical protein
MMFARVKYQGDTPGADTDVYVLFATTDVAGTGSGFINPAGANFFAHHGIKRVMLDMDHAAAVTLKWYKSSDRGVTWSQLGDSGSIAAPAAGESTQRDFLVEPYADWKLEATNGGSAQTVWSVDIALTDERSVAD